MGILKSLIKAGVGVAKLPVDIAADVITLGGSLNDKPRPYTADGFSAIVKNLEKAVDPHSD